MIEAAVTDLQRYRTSVRDWLEQADVPGVPIELDERFDVLRAWQRTLFDAGWMGIAWPRDSGGQGLTPLHQFAFSEELARAGAPQPIGLIGLDVIGPTIDHHASTELRQRLLPALLSGEDIWCQGFSEPDAGSDLASLRTRAEVDGDEFVITGQKVWTSWAHKASWCAVLARTDPHAPKHAGISYLLVNMSSPGIIARPIPQMTGDSEFCEVFFEQVRIPRENILGAPGDGWRIAMDTLSHERGGYGLRRRVEAEVALDTVVSTMRAGPWGPGVQPEGVGSLSRTQEQARAVIGRSHVAIRLLEATTRSMIERFRAGTGPSPLDSVDKLLLNEVEQEVYRCLAELLGSARISPDTAPGGLDTARLVLDQIYSRASSIYGGTSQIQKNIIAERLLGLPRG